MYTISVQWNLRDPDSPVQAVSGSQKYPDFRISSSIPCKTGYTYSNGSLYGVLVLVV